MPSIVRNVGMLLAGAAFCAIAAPQEELSAAHSSAIRPSPAVAELLAALSGQAQWLAQSSHGSTWAKHLKTEVLMGQLRLGDFANRAAVAEILARYSGDAPGLQHRRFVAVRLALRNWLVELELRRNTRWPAPIYAQQELTGLYADGELGAAHDRARRALHHYVQAAELTRAPLSVPVEPLRRELHGDGVPRLAVLEGAVRRLATDAKTQQPVGTRLRQALSAHARHLRRVGATAGMRIRTAAPREWNEARLPVQWFGADAWTLERCDSLLTRTLSRPRVYLERDDPPPGIAWHDDLAAACFVARQRQALLFLVLHDPAQTQHAVVQVDALRRLAAAKRGHRYVWACLPLDHLTSDAGRALRVMDHPALGELRGRPGIAIVDFENPAASHHEQVVSVFPSRPGQPFARGELAAILDLPPGTLTQRTITYAVRTHPDGPRGTAGLPHHVLQNEAASHSTHQARITLQGHHDWETRFHRINERLAGLTSGEVTAESWPNQSLLEAAVECVRCWRLSEGHWRGVHAPHAEYAYDMQRGANGVWYATGLFAD